jgi:hypothetical protein
MIENNRLLWSIMRHGWYLIIVSQEKIGAHGLGAALPRSRP